MALDPLTFARARGRTERYGRSSRSRFLETSVGERLYYYFFLLGTFFPAFRAWESPIAIACFLFFTFRPLPLFSVPFLRSCIAFPTFLDDAFEYLRAAIVHSFA